MSYTIHIDTKDSVKSIEELMKKVESLKKSLESMDKTSSSYSKTSKELANAQKKLANAQKSLADQASKTSSSMKDLNSNTEKVSSNLSKSTKSTKSATDNFKKMRDEIRDLRSDFYGTKEGTEEYNKALSALGDKMQEFKDMQAAANASAADFGAVCGNLVGVANGVVGGISALSGAMQIFGMGNSEFLEKLESKSMAVIQVVQGLAAVEDALTKKLPLVLNVYKQYNQKILDNIAARKTAKAQVESNTSAEAANTSATLANSAAKATNNGVSAASTSNTAANTAQVTANTAALSQNVTALDVLKTKLAGVDAEYESLKGSGDLNDIFNPDAGSGSVRNINTQNLQEAIDLYEKYGDAAKGAGDTLEEIISSAEGTAASMNETAGASQAASAGLSQTAGSAQAASAGLNQASASATRATKRFTLLNAVGHTLKTTWMNLRALWASNPLGLIIMGVGLLIAGVKKLVGWLDKISGTKIVIKDVRDELDETKESINSLNAELQHMVNMNRITKRESLESMLSTLKQERRDAQDLLNETNDQIHQLTSKKYFLGLGKNADSKLLEQAKKNQEELNTALKEYDKEITQTTWDIEELDYTQAKSVDSGKDSYQSKIDALKSWLESFEDGLKTEVELLEKSHNEELKKLKESLNAGLLTQDQYNELKLQSDKRYFDKRKALMKSSNEDLKKLLEELGSWESGQRSPMQEIIDEFNEGQDVLDKALDKGEISYEDYLKAMERLSARYAKKLRSALFDKVSGDVDDLNRKLQGKSSKAASNYDVEISNAESHGRIVDAVQLRIDKENELFRIEQEGIQKEIEMWQQAADSCKEGSDEQVEALERVAEAQERLNQSTNKHTMATNDNEQAMADAKIGYRSFNDALKATLGLTAEQANAFEMATNMAGDLMNELGNTIGAFADEALAQSENEELTEEAREKAFQQYKNLQIAQTTINFMSGLMATWKSAAEMTPPSSWIYGGAMTAMQSAQYALSIKAIKRQSMESPTTESAGSSFNIASPTYTTAEANIQAARPASDTKVYVLESDISNAQNKSKVRVNDTTF